MNNTVNPLALAKRCVDIGFFTQSAAPMLAFWREEMGLACEPPVEFNDGLTQYRHACGDSVIKINCARTPLPSTATAYRELLIADPACVQPTPVIDPDGNRIVRVPPGFRGITGIGLVMQVPAPASAIEFFTTTMGFKPSVDGGVSCGESVIHFAPGPAAANSHWVNTGLSYFTVHVMRVDAAYQTMCANGASAAEAPYSIGRIARISFIRDPDGNWVEVAQRAALAGPWWTDPA